MLLDLVSFLSVPNRLTGKHHGIVVSVGDEDRRGYIKVRIPGLIDGSIESLPWVAPNLPPSLGGSSGAQNFSVPIIDSVVTIEFDSNNPYCLYYTGWTPSGTTGNNPESGSRAMDDRSMGTSKISRKDLEINYPNRYGHVDDTGTGIIVDRQENSIIIGHSSGLLITLDGDGKLTGEFPDEWNLKFLEGVDITITTLLKTLVENIDTTVKEGTKLKSDTYENVSSTDAQLISEGGLTLKGDPIMEN